MGLDEVFGDATALDVVPIEKGDAKALLVAAEQINAALIDVLPADTKLTAEKTAAVLAREPAVRFDERTGSYAWVAVNTEFKFSQVVWLLPLDLPAADHLGSLAAALAAAAAAVPVALEWEVRAEFKTPGEGQAARFKADTWAGYFPGAKVDANEDGTEARISLPRLKDAIAATQAWKI